VPEQQRDVVLACAQRRQHQRQHRDAKVQILAEGRGVDHPAQVAVRGRDQTHVDRPVLAFAQALDGARFQHAQQLRLKRERQLADLVEEDRAAVRRLERPGARRHRARERAARMPEQLALDDRARQRRAVDDHERPRRARRRVVDRARGQLLARAGLAQDQHRRVGLRHARHLREQLAHRHAATDQAAEILARPQLDRRRRRRVAQHDLGPTHADPRAVRHQRRPDQEVLDEGSVAAAEIAYPRPAIGRLQLGVQPRDLAIRHPHLSAGRRPYRRSPRDHAPVRPRLVGPGELGPAAHQPRRLFTTQLCLVVVLAGGHAGSLPDYRISPDG
jgi:hypothetical protein